MHGFDCWKPCAPEIGEKVGGILKRVVRVCPHQPAYLGEGQASVTDSCLAPSRKVRGTLAYLGNSTSCHFSCTNKPAIPPGPELPYLYVHHTAKSTSQACSWMGTLANAWARSQPTMQPCARARSVVS
jgi:hypothetical protein